MSYTLGVDVGTFETKGVLVDGDGRIVAQAAHPHEMLVPQPGWAEHRPDEDWWGDFVRVTKALLASSGISAKEIKCIATSAIGPCMLPVDAAGRPLMNGVLYGVDTRSVDEIAELNDDPTVHGILVQLPLPPGISADETQDLLDSPDQEAFDRIPEKLRQVFPFEFKK